MKVWMLEIVALLVVTAPLTTIGITSLLTTVPLSTN
jgi:hypothetical protein